MLDSIDYVGKYIHMIENIPCSSYQAKYQDIFNYSDFNFCDKLKKYYNDMKKGENSFMLALRTPVDLCHLCRVIGKMTSENSATYGNIYIFF